MIDAAKEEKRTADEIGDRICPWCGDKIWTLKPAGGCIMAEINGYAWHAKCADEVEAAKAQRTAEGWPDLREVRESAPGITQPQEEK